MKLSRWQFIAVFFAAILFCSCAQENKKSVDSESFSGKKPKYIFYFIGDGFGLNQSNAAESYLAAVNGKKGVEKLTLNTFPVTGFYTTYSSSQLITDSAAGGTALATGEKTSNGTVSMDDGHKQSFATIAETARDNGKKVGIVSTVSIDHATPACFYAHQSSRNKYYEIDMELGVSKFNYFAGGGLKDPSGAKKEKEVKDAFELAKENGYNIVNTVSGFNALAKGDDKVFAISERLAGGKSMPYAIDKKSTDISLAEFTQKGIDLLENPDGFFMMIESGKIDWACHANDAATSINEVLILDEAVKKAYEFYKKHPDETLIVVCGDHETGGMGLGFSGKHYGSSLALLKNQKASYEVFTEEVKQYCSTKGANFDGAMKMVTENFGLGNGSEELKLTDFDKEQLKRAFKQSMTQGDKRKKDAEYYQLYGSYDPLSLTACHLLAQKAGIGWTTYSHTAAPIPIRAIGVGQELFEGYYDNTDVAKNVRTLL